MKNEPTTRPLPTSGVLINGAEIRIAPGWRCLCGRELTPHDFRENAGSGIETICGACQQRLMCWDC
jgi:hypothetical protein